MNSIDPQSLPHVIGAGMGRTGTKSLKRALETLGAGPIFHMENALPTAPRLGQYWEALAKLTPVSMLPNGDPLWPPWAADRTHGLEKEHRVDLLRHVLGWSNRSILETQTKEKVPFPLSFLLGEWMTARETVQFQGNVDFPLFVHFMDLLEVYRDDGRPVKVILTSRETGETWAKSALDSILNYHPSRRPWGIQVFCSTIFRIPDRMLENTFYRYFPNDMSDESKALGPLAEMHDSWNDYVRESMKSYAEQQGIPLDSIFLDYQVMQGWKPLCDFLEVDECPSIYFPHDNDAQHQAKVQRIMNLCGYAIAFVPLCLALVTIRFILYGKKASKTKVS